MSAFLAVFDVLAAGTILGALLLVGLFIWFALDDHVIPDGVERRRREAPEAPRDRAPEGQPEPRGADGPPDQSARRPSLAPLRSSTRPGDPDDPSRPRRAA